MKYDIVITGLGGQGVLTIGNLIAEAALQNDIAGFYYPLKGMAQRGGFVKVQVRLGRENPGPYIPLKGADLIIAMERSETLKAIPYIKPGKEFLIYNHTWVPTAVLLGKESYPTLDHVHEEIIKANGKMICINPEDLPAYEDHPVPPNIFILGSIMGHTDMAEIMDPSSMLLVIKNRWKKEINRNAFAFQSGMEANLKK